MVGTPEWWRSKCNEEGVMMPYRSCKGVRDDPVPGKPPGVTKRSDLSYFERRPYSDRLAPSSRAAASPGRRIAEPAATAPAVRTARRVWKYPIAIAPLSVKLIRDVGRDRLRAWCARLWTRRLPVAHTRCARNSRCGVS